MTPRGLKIGFRLSRGGQIKNITRSTKGTACVIENTTLCAHKWPLPTLPLSPIFIVHYNQHIPSHVHPITTFFTLTCSRHVGWSPSPRLYWTVGSQELDTIYTFHAVNGKQIANVQHWQFFNGWLYAFFL